MRKSEAPPETAELLYYYSCIIHVNINPAGKPAKILEKMNMMLSPKE